MKNILFFASILIATACYGQSQPEMNSKIRYDKSKKTFIQTIPPVASKEVILSKADLVMKKEACFKMVEARKIQVAALQAELLSYQNMLRSCDSLLLIYEKGEKNR